MSLSGRRAGRLRPFLLLLLAGAAGAYWYSRSPAEPACARPIGWSIGVIDSRFGESSDAVHAAADAATAIWSSAAGKPLFVYDPASPLAINLVYDSRQADALTRAQLAARQAAQDSVREGLDALESSFHTQQDLYNDKVRRINASGGASQLEIQLLEEEKQSLHTFSDSIQRAVAAFNAQNAAINAEVTRFNQHGDQTLVAGEYVRDRHGRRINAFKFIGDSELTRLLAHEFGHALGLGHNHDPESIMYEKSETGSLTPSSEDRASLRRFCGW